MLPSPQKRPNYDSKKVNTVILVIYLIRFYLVICIIYLIDMFLLFHSHKTLFGPPIGSTIPILWSTAFI